MKVWTEIILEWLNCLDISEVTDLKELDDRKFYKKLISLFSWKGTKSTSDTNNIITEFLQDEYPEFKFDYNDLGDMEHIYIASLFLLHVSQEPRFYQPMCIKLQHETQLKIKTFLETIIPYGKSINKDILKEVISELEGNRPKTPITPKTRALKDFFKSPAARSAQVHKLLNERNQELRKLRSELEVERFEKSDLQEDLRIQQSKIQSLQKKLQEKSAEVKFLQEEQNKLNTPQSCKKNKNTEDHDRYYRREIDHLEDQLMQKQYEIDKLEGANDTLTKKLSCMEKQCRYFKEKLEQCEKYLESTQMIGELKDRELMNLKMTNEELRIHLKELNKTTMAEQSFEIDGITPLVSSLNSSEVLSSVIDIQLQEAKEESASLKMQLDTLNKKLESVNQDFENTTELLKEKSRILQDTETKSNITVNKLEKEIESLQKEKKSLIDKNKNLQNECTFQKENLSLAEKCKDTLNTEITSLRGKIKTLEESLETGNVHNAKLNAELAETKLQINQNLKHIQDLTDQNNLYKTSVELYNKHLKEFILNISKTDCKEVNDLDATTTLQLIEYLRVSLHNLTEKYTSKQIELHSLNNAMEKTKLEINDFRSQIVELEEKNKEKIAEISKLKVTDNQNVKKISKLTSTVKQYSEEIAYLKEVQVQKQSLEKDLCACKEELNKKTLLLTSSEKRIQTLKTDFQNLVTDFNTVKKHILNKLTNCQKQHKQTCNNILNAYETLYDNYTKERLYKDKLEHELTDNKKELKDIKNLNITLENDLIKNKQIISDLEVELTNTKDKLIESVQKAEEIEKIKKTLEEQQKDIKNLNITLENDLIKNKQIISDLELELTNTKDKLIESVQKAEEIEKIKKTLEEQEKDIKNLNITLENDLIKNKQIISDLELELTNTKDKLIESVQKAEEIEKNKKTLEEQQKDIKNLNITLENDLIKNKQIISDLKVELTNTKDKLIESVQKAEEIEKNKKTLEEQQKDIKNLNIILENDLIKNKQIISDLKVELTNTKEKLIESVQKAEEIEKIKKTLEEQQKDIKNLNITLENDLIKNKQIISDLELELMNTKDKLIESVQKAEEIGEIKERLEKQQKNLESEYEKILINLNTTRDELKSSQEEVCNISDQLKCKNEEIRNLITEINSLKLEKEQTLCLQTKRESEVKNLIQNLETQLLEKQRSLDQSNIEIKSKEEALEHVQNKLEKLTAEATVSEMKMKEVISNLQEVRTNQEAVLVTQEKALKEKCLIIEQLQNEFSESRSTLCKQLENEKLLSQNLQSTNSKLQIQSYKQTKTIEELQESLKKERNELSKSKEYCEIQNSKKLEIVRVCELLKNSVNDLKSVVTEKSPKDENLYDDDTCNEPCANNDDNVENILKIIRISINEVQASHKLILHLSNMNTNLNESLHNQKEIVNNYAAKHKEYMKHLNNIIENKSMLKNSLENVLKLRETLDTSLDDLKQKWDALLTKYHNIFIMDKSLCDELKYLQNKKAHFDDILFKQYIHHYQNIKPLQNILWQKFTWSEQQLKDAYLNPIKCEKMLDTFSNIFSDEDHVIQTELQKHILLQKDINQFHNEVDDFSNLVMAFEINFRSNETKFQSEAKKLQLQIDQLTEDKHNLECKLECAQLNNAKLENETKELKVRIKELKATSSEEMDDLRKELMQLKNENLMLQEERNELINRPKKEDVDNQLKDIHDKYKLKLDEIKQNMKTAYNEQIAKLNIEQEQCVQERLESLQKKMELQCRKQADELSKYKAHVASMSTQIWDIGEKLLSEQQEKEKLQKELSQLKAKYEDLNEKIVSSIEHKSAKFERKDVLGENKEEILHKIAVIQERTTYERKYSIRNIQTMGNAFNAEDEEEVFDNVYLADMKDGNTSSNIDIDRLSTLKKRNALCKPHLKSSYPAEMQFHPLPFSEEEIKAGSVPEDIFNDSLSQSLLPEQKLKKKDRTQISYKKPGPPTPSKNGGRLSLQGNELKSPNSRILKERNKDRATTTPRTLKGLFSSKRQDENTVITPRSRRSSSIFRKYRGTNNR